MSLILLRQIKTGTDGGTGADIYELKQFNTATLAVVTSSVTDSMLSPFEMATNQPVHTQGTTLYTYDGAGGVNFGPIPSTPIFFLILIIPNGSGVYEPVLDGFYQAGDSIALSAGAITDYTFIRWHRSGITVSEVAAFNYLMPAGDTFLTAEYILTADIPPAPPSSPDNPADPVPLPTTFYPLEIRVASAQIPLPGLVQRFYSGIFSEELIGDYSYPVTIPLDPQLMSRLGNPNDPQSNTDFSQPIPAELWSQGNRIFIGSLDILEAGEDAIRASFILDSGFFIQANNELKLADCYTDQDEVLLSEKPVIAVSGYQIQVAYQDYTVTVNGNSRNFLKAEYDDEIAILEAIAAWLATLALGLEITVEYDTFTEDEQTFVDRSSSIVYFDTTTVTTTTVTRIRPADATANQYFADPFLNYRKLTSKRIDLKELTDVDPANRIAFPSVYVRELYEGNNTAFSGVVNAFDGAGFLHFSNIDYPNFGEAQKWKHTAIPFLYLKDILLQIFRKLKITVTGEFLDDPRLANFLIFNNRTLDFLRITWFGVEQVRVADSVLSGEANGLGQWRYENVLSDRISLGNHVPDVTVTEFLKALKSYFGLVYEFNTLQNRVNIRYISTVIQQRSVLDLTKQVSRLYSITHKKETGIAFSYANPDPLLSDGAKVIPASPDYTVTNYLALDALDAALQEIAFVSSLRAYFRFVPDGDDPPFWQLEAFIQQSDPESPNTRTWNISLVPLVDGFISGRKMPSIECTANAPEAGLTNTDCGIRLFAYYGMQDDGEDVPYAFASATRYTAKEVSSETQYDLDIRSEDSYPAWQHLEQLIDRAKYFECALLLSESDIISMSKTPKIRIANIDYLIDEYEIANTTGEFAVAKAKLYKVK